MGLLTTIEGLKVRLMVRLTWRSSRARLLASLRHFSATEADSAWQLGYAAAAVADPEQKAELFRQILEETHHAAEFARLYAAHSEQPLVPARYERKALYPDPADVGRFFVYCHVGEAAAAERFKHLHDAIPDGPVRDVLRQILRDEAQHVHNASELVAETGMSAERLRSETRRIKARRAWEAWLRAGRGIADVVATGILAVAYIAVGALGAWAAKRRFAGAASTTAVPATAPARALPVAAREVAR